MINDGSISRNVFSELCVFWVAESPLKCELYLPINKIFSKYDLSFKFCLPTIHLSSYPMNTAEQISNEN